MHKYIKQPFAILVRPKSEDQEERNREYILNVLLTAGWLLIIIFGILIYFVGVLILHRYYPISRLYSDVLALLYLSCLFVLSKKGFFRASALLLVGGFLAVSAFLVLTYGIFLPQGLLISAFTIVMAGILLSSRASFVVATVSSLIMLSSFVLHKSGLVHQDISWQAFPPEIGDVFGMSATFFAITTVSWLLYHRMQHSLARAERSERALREQQDLLEIKVRERTRELQIAQAEKLSQLNKFAELGYTTTALFHDLANRITVLAMDVETLGKKHGSEELVKQTNESIQYIEDMVRQVRLQVQGHETPKEFTIKDEIDDLIDALSYKTKRKKVAVKLNNNVPRNTRYYGDQIGFRQIVGNFIGNAIGAYDEPGPSEKGTRDVVVSINRTDEHYTVAVTDFGRGISPERMEKIFEPFYTTKKKGMGIGLFIAKLQAEQQFGATVTAESKLGEGSTFTLTLPRKKTGGKSASSTS